MQAVRGHSKKCQSVDINKTHLHQDKINNHNFQISSNKLTSQTVASIFEVLLLLETISFKERVRWMVEVREGMCHRRGRLQSTSTRTITIEIIIILTPNNKLIKLPTYLPTNKHFYSVCYASPGGVAHGMRL